MVQRDPLSKEMRPVLPIPPDHVKHCAAARSEHTIFTTNPCGVE